MDVSACDAQPLLQAWPGKTLLRNRNSVRVRGRFSVDSSCQAAHLNPTLHLTAAASARPLPRCDPLDGTTNFVHSFPFVCVSIALVINK